MAKDWRKFSAAAELSRRLDRFETALRRAKHDEELRRYKQEGLRRQVTHLPSGEPIGILIDDEPAPVHKKLTGKEWVEKHAAEFDPNAVSITEAGTQLSAKSKNAKDCAKSLTVGHCINLLRGLNRWPKKPRNPLKGPRRRRK